VTLFFAIINLFLMALLSYQVWRRQQPAAKRIFWPALLVKLTSGLCLGWLYMNYYEGIGDTMLYFKDSMVLSTFARKDPIGYLSYLWNTQPHLDLISDVASQPRSIYLLKLASVFNLLTHDNYWMTSAYFSFVSFFGAWYFVTQVARTVPSAYWPAVVAFLFLPTAVFWSSGLIKESLAMAGLCLLWGCFLRLWFALTLRPWEILLAFVAAWVVWSLKYYFLGALVPVAMASLFLHKMFVTGITFRSLFSKILIWILVMLVPLVLVTLLHPNFQPDRLMGVIVDNYLAFQNLSAPEDLISYHDLRPEWQSLLVNSPKAAFAGLFRPMIWEASNVLQALVAIENTLLLVLAFTSIGSMRQVIRSPYRLLIGSVLVYAVALATFLALSTPNFGTLSRYRVGFLPLLAMVLLTGNPFVSRLLQRAQRYLGALA
jgi:hypothetical protein